MVEIIKKDFELEDHGIIYLNGKINPEMYEYVSREIIRHNCKGKQKFIQMIINSPGGYLTDGFAIIDTMKWSEIPIHTYAIGEACSAAFLIFIAGKKGHRIMTPNTVLISHQFSGGSIGTHSDMKADRKKFDDFYKKMIKHYIKHTKLKTKKEVEKYLLKEVDTYVTSKEAIRFGIADKIQK